MSEDNFSITYIVQYTNSNRTEGGPVVTRHFESRNKALDFIAIERKNPYCDGFTLTKQTTVITKERLEIEQGTA